MRALTIFIVLTIITVFFIWKSINGHIEEGFNRNKKVDILLIDEKRNMKNMDYVIGDQQFQVRVRLDVPSYVYIFNLDTYKRLYDIFPKTNIAKQNPLQEGEHYFPSQNTVYQFASGRGIEIFYIFICKKRIMALEKLRELILPRGYDIDKKDKKALDFISFYVPGGKGKSNFYYDKLILLYSPRERGSLNNEIYRKAEKELKTIKIYRSRQKL